jgi:hypothetical protein
MPVFPEVVTASLIGAAGYEYLRGMFSVKGIILLSVGALLLYLVLSGQLEKFGRAIQ